MRSYLTFILACVCAFIAAVTARGEGEPPAPVTTDAAPPADGPDLVERELQKRIDRYRRRVWHWQRVMGRPVTLRLPHPPSDLAARVPAWRRVASRTWTRAQHPPHALAWRCIQRFEGAWTDSGPPYYGGLQMDLGFQRTYGRYLIGRKGTADRWTPLEQMWVAERGFRAGRGFSPWPNTARACGLI